MKLMVYHSIQPFPKSMIYRLHAYTLLFHNSSVPRLHILLHALSNQRLHVSTIYKRLHISSTLSRLNKSTNQRLNNLINDSPFLPRLNESTPPRLNNPLHDSAFIHYSPITFSTFSTNVRPLFLWGGCFSHQREPIYQPTGYQS